MLTSLCCAVAWLVAPQDPAAALAARVRAGCTLCHALPAVVQAAAPRGPDLREAIAWHRRGLTEYLAQHHGGEQAADLAAFLRSLADDSDKAPALAVTASAIERGEQLFARLACAACHAPDHGQELSARVDHRRVRAFLLEPAAHRPSAWHDFQLTADEADALAAWLLRAQRTELAAPVPGFLYQCYEVQITGAGPPDLAELQPQATGVTEQLSVAVATRKDHFALRFTAQLEVPEAGEWQFTCGSDDSSWLWIDGKQVVRNEALAPYRRKSGKVELTAGWHELVVLYTEAAGEEKLEVLWRGPKGEESPIPAARARAQQVQLHAPTWPSPSDEPAVARGRAAANARQCAACHAGLPDTDAIPLPTARGLLDLPQEPCRVRAQASAALPPLTMRDCSPETALQTALHLDGCLACHGRNGAGGLNERARSQLVEQEDLGDEGRLPPDLTNVGHRLRATWIASLLAGGPRARPYLQVRMPKLSSARAKDYADWLSLDDLAADLEPPFTPEAGLRGAQLVGLGGRNCVTCHAFAGRRAFGPQGMDLAIQYQRLRPQWFGEWLLAPQQLRPGTRMLAAWLDDGPQAQAEVAAIRSWLSLGAAAPLPTGMAGDQGLLLAASHRPVLHGAFFAGLSARCIAVGTPLRAHYAFDVEHAALRWLWRGEFVDATGTWVGRAGELVRPASQDQRLLADFTTRGKRTTVGRREAHEGLPTFLIAVDAARYEDTTVPELRAGGAVFVRTLRCTQGAVHFDFTAHVVGDLQVQVPGAQVELRAGDSLEVRYQW